MLSWFVSGRCVGCDSAILASTVLCEVCAGGVISARDLTPQVGGYASCTSVLRYERTGRLLVLALKDGDRRMVRPAGRLIARDQRRLCLPDLVTWAPTSEDRRRARGYDQAQELARWAARWMGVPCRRLLTRSVGSPAQHGRSRDQRQNGPAFVPLRASAGRVLVIDDVITTGATLRAAGVALRRGGAQELRAATLAVAGAQHVLKKGELSADHVTGDGF